MYICVYKYIHMQTGGMLLCIYKLYVSNGSIVILSLLRQYLIYVDRFRKHLSINLFLSCVQTVILESHSDQISFLVLSTLFSFFFLFFFQEIICQKNNVSMMYWFQLNYKHSKLLFHLMLFIFCFPLESFSTLLLYFTELDVEFWKF